MSEQSDLVEKLVGELVATGTLWPETAADLQRFVEEAKAGTLWADDLNYLIALHAKVINGERRRARPSKSPCAYGYRRKVRRDQAAVRRALSSRRRAATWIRRCAPRVYGDFWPAFEDVERR